MLKLCESIPSLHHPTPLHTHTHSTPSSHWDNDGFDTLAEELDLSWSLCGRTVLLSTGHFSAIMQRGRINLISFLLSKQIKMQINTLHMLTFTYNLPMSFSFSCDANIINSTV